MERVCFIAELKPGVEDEYKFRHDEIWPDLIEAFHETGWRNFCLFRRGSTVIATVECHPNLATAREALDATEVNGRWSAYMANMFSHARDEDGNLLYADEIWHLP